ncbi:MAG TPA: HAD family hydrolase [Bacteroidota bacterium]|nr:HAD family hydrolase [Bacteroidota bacterium]
MKVQNVGIFFDRDGTLNTEVDYLSRPEELTLLPGAARSIREANEAGVKVFVITNQSGIARGFFSEADLGGIHERLKRLLALEGAHIDKIYYCPHHPTFGIPPYRVDCTCRKPNTGMVEQAAREFNINLLNSFVVGDRCIDVQTGERAGCGTILVRTGYGATEASECGKISRVDHIAEDVYDAWRYIKRQLRIRH